MADVVEDWIDLVPQNGQKSPLSMKGLEQAAQVRFAFRIGSALSKSLSYSGKLAGATSVDESLKNLGA